MSLRYAMMLVLHELKKDFCFFILQAPKQKSLPDEAKNKYFRSEKQLDKDGEL